MWRSGCAAASASAQDVLYLGRGSSYPVALDPRLTMGNQYGFTGSPYTVVVDRKGEIAARLVGESAVGKLPRILDDLLRREG